MSGHQLDVRYMLCPMPVIRTQQAIEHLRDGDTLTVVGTDPGVVHDIPAWCRVHGHEILGISEQDEEITISIRVGKE